MNVYPIFLNNLSDRRCVVIGTDKEAERKVGQLLACDAPVVVIGTEPTDALRRWADAGAITWIDRDYRPGDLADAFLVIISETNPERTRPIWEEAQAEKALINAMDDIPHCTFVAGSVIRRGPLVLSISTSGCAPALSVRLRERFEEEFGPEFATFLELMGRLRTPLAERYPFAERKRRWYRLVDSNVLDLLKAEKHEEAHQLIESIMAISIPEEAQVAS